MAQSKNAALRWRNLKTGMLFLAGMIILGWLGFIIGGNSGLLAGHKTLHFFTANSQNLREGGFVGIAGKKVGTVGTIEFLTRGATKGVDVKLEIENEYFSMITRDSKALIKGLGILGDKVVDIEIGPSKSRIQDNGELATASEAGMEDLTANAISTMRNVDTLTAKILHGEGTLGKLITTTELNDKINQTLTNLNTVEDRITNGKGLVPRLLNDGDLAQQVSQTTKDLREMTAKLKEGNGSLGKFLMGDEFLGKLNQVSAHTDSLLTQLSNPNGSLAKITNDPTLYNNLNGTAESAHRAIGSLDSLLTDFKKNPSRYVHVSVF